MADQKKAVKPPSETSLVTDKVRLSYCHIWEPVAAKGSAEKKYSVSLIIPKSNTALIARIQKAIDVAIEEGIKDKWKGKKPLNLKLPLRDGDKEREDEAYANSYFLNASSKAKPGVVDKSVQPILDESELYSGCYGKVAINLYPFDSNGSKGIAVGLNHIQKVADGEPLGGRGAPTDFFEVEEGDDLM